MFRRAKALVGLDIGSSAVKAVELKPAGKSYKVTAFGTEPLPPDSPLRRSDRIMLTPHTAGSTRESFTRMTALLVDNLRRAVTGEPVLHVVNGADAVVRRR